MLKHLQGGCWVMAHLRLCRAIYGLDCDEGWQYGCCGVPQRVGGLLLAHLVALA